MSENDVRLRSLRSSVRMAHRARARRIAEIPTEIQKEAESLRTAIRAVVRERWSSLHAFQLAASDANRESYYTIKSWMSAGRPARDRVVKGLLRISALALVGPGGEVTEEEDELDEVAR